MVPLMKTRQILSTLLPTTLLLGGLLFSAIPAIADETLVIYSGRSDKFVKPVMKAFTEQTGIAVTLHSGKSTALLNKLKLEGAATSADLYLSNDAGNLQKGSDLGLFRPVDATLAAPIDANYRAGDNSWIGLSARARVLVVNTEGEWADKLDSVFDLADPALKSQLAITNSSNGSFIAGVTVYMLAAGKEKTRQWLQGMKANVDGRVFNKHSKIVKAVAQGRKQVGLVNHYYIYRHLARHPDAPIRIVLPDQGPDGIGVAWNVAGIAISKHSKKSAQAEKLVAFLVSRAGQKMFAEMNMEYPTRGGVPAAKQVPPAGSYKVADVPMAELGRQRDATLDLIEAVGMP
ncbi:MAG TPA: extracellular solute-binding protein [Gammaproteobacteria bacterium]|nr:extracellular solute-binding protein [Gammaproteobacteria bacterium]